MEQILNYAKGVNANQSVLDWIDSRVVPLQEKNQTEIEHIIDYLVSDKAPNLERATYDQMKINAAKWAKALQKKGDNIQEGPEDTKVVLDFKDGMKIVQLVGEKAYKREGMLMRHCVASYFGRKVEIYSLRDKNNEPHCTIEKDVQIKGKGNGSIHPRYINYVVEFLEWAGMEVRDSEMVNLGYINVEKLKKDIDIKQLFKGKYWYKDAKLLDKKGNEYQSLDLLDYVPLIGDTQIAIKINFQLSTFIALSFDFLKKSIGRLSKKKSTGDSSKLAASGHYSKLAASGDSSRLAASGHYSQLAASGDYSQLAASGDSSKLAASGHSSKLAASGHSSQLAASGDYSQLAASGHYSQLAASGHSSKLAASGDGSQLAASGAGSQLELTGQDSIAANIGIGGKVKGKKGCWLTLAEWGLDEGIWKPICVRSEMIDGEKIKEDTWYELAGGKYVEA